MTPNIYNQSYEEEYESFELEAIDALSTLDYFKYEPLSGRVGIVTLEELLIACIKKCNAYEKIYLTNVNRLDWSSTSTDIYKKLIISEQNFIGEDEDETFTYREVLQEVCQIFGMTAIAVGSSVYFIDYDAIKKGMNEYLVYSSADGFQSPVIETCANGKTIAASDYMDTGSSLSLGNVYNKISVTNNKYTIKNILPELFAEENLTNTMSSVLPYYSYTQTFGDTHYVYRTYWDKNWEHTYYRKDGSWSTVNPTSLYYSSLQNFIGASFIKIASYENGRGTQGTLSFNNYICFSRHLWAHPSDEHNKTMPVLKLKSDAVKPMILGADCYLVISGSGMWTDIEGRICPILDGRKKDNYDPAKLCITAKLKIGNKCWNGLKWTTADTTFKIYFDDSDTSHYIGKWTDIKNTLSWQLGINATGCGIPIAASDGLSGTPEFILYSPQIVDGSYRVDALWLRDIKIEVNTKERWNDTDTLYTNVINEAFVSEFDEIQTKIGSYDNKDFSYSCIGDTTNSAYTTYWRYLYNKGLDQLYLKPEQALVYRYVNQYSTPASILELTLKDDLKPYTLVKENNLKKEFIIDTMSIDYANQTNEVKLIEKK